MDTESSLKPRNMIFLVEAKFNENVNMVSTIALAQASYEVAKCRQNDKRYIALYA